jgi:hypothetical protein
MLTDTQKKAIKLITTNTSVEYRDRVGASDEFALSELQALLPNLLKQKQEAAINLTNQAGIIARDIAQTRADIALIKEVLHA